MKGTPKMLNERHMLWVRLDEDGNVVVAPGRANTEMPPLDDEEWVIINEDSDPDFCYPDFENEMREFLSTLPTPR
jgi:hypothetical protein